MEETRTFEIPEGNLPVLQTRIDKLNRRALRLSMPPIVVRVTGEIFKPFERKAQLGETPDKIVHGQKTVVEHRKYFLVQIEGQAPKIAGWTFVATLQHEQGGNILRTLPGFDASLPQKYRTAGTDCDHCGHDRRRKDTYILLADAGDFKQVGRSCLRDFLGHTNPEKYAEWAEVIADLSGLVGDLEEELGSAGGGRGTKYYPLEGLLTLSRRVIRGYGWVSWKTSEEKSTEEHYFPSTASRVFNLLEGSPKGKVIAWEKLDQDAPVPEGQEVEPLDVADAIAAIEWAKNLPEDISNDYQWNLRLLANSEQISPRSMGLAVSMVSAYMREQDRMSEIVRKSKGTRPSNYFGYVKVREEFVLTVTHAHEYESNFGVKTLVTFEDQEGNRAKWFASGSVINGWDSKTNGLVPVWEEGKTYKVKATPTHHEVYKGQKETTLSRVVNLGEVIPPAPLQIEAPKLQEEVA